MPCLRSLLIIPLLAPLACVADDGGDDLPPGAFTSGPDSGAVVDTSSSTTMDPTVTVTASNTSTPTTTSASSSGDPIDYTHSEHILPVWTESCIDASCHDADTPAANLDLMSEGVYERICAGVHPLSGTPLIDCEGGDPQGSYIFRKLEGTHDDGTISGGSGAPMPPAGPLSDATLNMIESWISQGAMP